MNQPSLIEVPATPVTPSAHKSVVDGFCQRFERKFGNKYLFNGRDAKAVKAMLDQGLMPEDILAVAEQAWTAAAQPRAFASKNAWTLHGLSHHWNSIVAELTLLGGLSSSRVRAAEKGRF